MNTHADKTSENKSKANANSLSKLQANRESSVQFIDNRPKAITQGEIHEMANNSPQVSQLKSFQEMANNRPQAKETAQLRTKANNQSAQQQSIQKKENNTGLPDNLKTGVENLSGISLDDVKVHRNSDKPAQLQAHAYAQGTDIHLGAGQEKHLPHEAWHVVQQKQGRVKPTMQMKGGVSVNDETGLETEADVMGLKALSTPVQLKEATELIQGKFGTIQLLGDDESLLPEDKSIEEQFERIRLFGRQADKLNERILSKRSDDVLNAAKDLAKIWGKAAVFAGLDTLAPGLGTGLGYAEAAAGAAKDLNDAHKTREVKSTAKETIAETAVTEGATQGLDAALGGVHWSAGAAIGSAKAVYKAGKAVGQSERGRKGDKIASILAFKAKIYSLEAEIMNECGGLIEYYQLGSRSDGPTAVDIEREQQVQKAKERLEMTFQAMTEYCDKNSEYVGLLENQERSDDL